MEVTQLHIPAALPQGKEPTVRWITLDEPKNLSECCGKIFYPLLESNPDSSAVQPVVRRCFDWCVGHTIEPLQRIINFLSHKIFRRLGFTLWCTWLWHRVDMPQYKLWLLLWGFHIREDQHSSIIRLNYRPVRPNSLTLKWKQHVLSN
jgi:hypothetical protein